MNAIIIDDEKTGTQGLKVLIEQHCPGIAIKAIEHSPEEGIKRILDLDPDLVFLDIEMPPLTGFDVIEATPGRRYQVIFTTAYDHYAIKAFKAQAVDYLLKPIDAEELKLAVKNAQQRSAVSNTTINRQLESLLKNINTPVKKIPLPTGKGVTMVAADEIVYLESDSNYTTIFFKTGKQALISKTLKSFEEKLSATVFCRVHAAYIVNLDEIDQYIKGDGGTLILKNKISIPVSRVHKQELMNRLGL